MNDSDDTTHHDDACTAVGVAVLGALADGALAATVTRDGNGGFLVEVHSGLEEEED